MNKQTDTNMTTEATDLLIELGCEELPPKSLPKLGQALFQGFCTQLKQAELNFCLDNSKVYYTPRRLALLISGVAARQPDQVIERKGPAHAAAFNSENQATPAALGFARSVSKSVEELETLKTEKVEADSQINRLEAKLLEKDEEVTKAKTAATDSLTETKSALAGQLLTARLVLKKEDVTSISTKDEYPAKLTSFTERKLDSLKDSISDLSLEVASAMKSLGVKSAADFAADTIEDDVTSTATDSKETVVAPKPQSKDEALNSYFK